MRSIYEADNYIAIVTHSDETTGKFSIVMELENAGGEIEKQNITLS